MQSEGQLKKKMKIRLMSIVDLDAWVTFARSVSEFYQQFLGNGGGRSQMGGIKDKWKWSRWKQRMQRGQTDLRRHRVKMSRK